MRYIHHNRKLWVAVMLAGFLLIISVSSATASEPPNIQAAPNPQGVANETCLSCHGSPGMQTTLPSGEILYLTVDPQVYEQSIHGQQGYACVQCHVDIREYPHRPLEAETRRDVSLLYYKNCARCHQDKYDATLDSVHQAALEAGNEEAALCVDCHGYHDVRDPNESLTSVPQTCERCHSQIFAEYSQSVHGSALIGEGNPDVPTCIDCHGVHNVSGPSETGFHLFSPQLCAECHADQELMGKYGISTNVFNSYVSDFHGTTVIFEQQFEGQETNKPVCIDCHGVHIMKMVDDAESQVIRENLLVTCQRCHPDASSNFTDSWLGHYEPDLNRFPAVYLVDLFYRIFIPAVLGFMVLFVFGDATRRLINRRRERNDE
ncbi:MAG: cytochrome c3 family protein [Chloroflexota bacterium]|nr:MAG: cytochrome c3 family protein [Chloroflexota bacterium]